VLVAIFGEKDRTPVLLSSKASIAKRMTIAHGVLQATVDLRRARCNHPTMTTHAHGFLRVLQDSGW
jgi:hypothetical protein